jgi:hypothetical protein
MLSSGAWVWPSGPFDDFGLRLVRRRSVLPKVATGLPLPLEDFLGAEASLVTEARLRVERLGAGEEEEGFLVLGAIWEGMWLVERLLKR